MGSTGPFLAATTLLPSTFSMYAVTYAAAAILEENWLVRPAPPAWDGTAPGIAIKSDNNHHHFILITCIMNYSSTRMKRCHLMRRIWSPV